jgi:murein L,D-transpeptidase YafK
MKHYFILFFLTACANLNAQNEFLNNQKKFERISNSINEKEKDLTKKLKDFDLNFGNLNLLIVAFKAENKLEIYVKNKAETKYKKFQTYNICEKSGQLGPKRQSGDLQVPEGFYYIDRFNPTSTYFLSLGINYPNQADKIKSTAKNLGGDIFIHGECVTIGCLPMTNDKIKEIYLLAIQAKNNGQNNIPVYIFPFKMEDNNLKNYQKKYESNVPLLSFWNNLKIGYDQFQNNHLQLKVKVATTGNYTF